MVLWPKPLDLRLERGFDRPVRRLHGDHASPGIGDTASLADVLDQLREDLGGTAAVREVIRSFLDETPSVLSALRDAAARADVPSIRRAAHMIKGTSSILGARELSEQCAEIERVGQTGCIDNAALRVITVEALYRTIEAALEAEIERLRP